MSNLNGLRQLISLAMRDGHKTVNIPLETASMIVVEYEKHRVSASKLKGELKRCQRAWAVSMAEQAERDSEEGES